jgi:hypothetical protein
MKRSLLKMRLFTLTILLTLAVPFSVPAQESAATRVEAEAHQQKGIERRTPADPDVAISLCLASGDVFVRGWDRNEVRAVADGRVVFSAAKAGKGLDVFVSHEAVNQEDIVTGSCEASSDVELNVPRGASIRINVRDGDVDVSDVAEARIDSLNGDVSVKRVARYADVSCLSGDISLTQSKGRVHLKSVSGYVAASNLSPIAPTDDVVAESTSGDVSLEHVGHAKVKGAAISGDLRMVGPLVGRGIYEFTSTSGDVTLELPADASFRLNARVVFSGEIITDFPVTITPSAKPSIPEPPQPPDRHGPGKNRRPPKEPTHTTLAGVVGSGSAELKLTSFSGTLYLKKQ